MDAYAAIKQNRLKYLHLNQKKLRVDLYQGLQDAIVAGDNSAAAIRERIIVPFFFTGGPCHMVQNYQDGMAIYRWARCPDAFVTFTCNPQWPEIKKTLLLGQQPQDRSDLVTRVFKIKLKELINNIHKKHILGCTIVGIYVIEFQKRGLPHAHIFIFFAEDCKPHTIEDIDHMISAELPNPNPKTNRLAHETVATCMMQGPCGAAFPNAPCMEDGKCKKNIHINVEVCNNIRAVKYMFKYVYKGHDRATVEISRHNDNATEGNVVKVNEIKIYLDCRYVSASEATWRIFKFDMHEPFPIVERLQYHLPNQQMVLFDDDDDV